jgi:hypothetical protein
LELLLRQLSPLLSHLNKLHVCEACCCQWGAKVVLNILQYDQQQ